ncbi:MAG TPA: c-type cytochrome [Desulfuromonadales bacterium]|nr:c-type cytochrome [Desulfuromonadales bacterium]
MSDKAQKPPFWINRLLTVAALLACLSALAVLYFGWERDPHHHHGLIADITVNLGGRPQREHCTTCHPGGGLAVAAGKHAHHGHPDIAPHSAEKLGCTGCHLGEGMALDAQISHGLPGLGARTVLKGKELQANCYRCHELGPLPGAEPAWRGYRIFLEKACDTCHHVAGLGQGGRFGPDLSAVGSYLGLAQLEESIREPKKEPANSIMPRFPLSGGQVAQLSYFLKSRVKDPLYATPMQVQGGRVTLPQLPTAADEAILQRKRCLACHQFGEEDGRIAPDLTYIGAQRSADFLSAFLANPARLIPGAVMPTILLSEAERGQLLQMLTTEAIGPVLLHATEEENGHSDHGAVTDPLAKHLYMALCQRCHAASGDGHGPIQPNLAGFPRAFKENSEFFRRLDDDRLARNIEKGIPGTSMPPYGRLLEPESRERLLDLLFSAFIDVARHDKAELQPLPARASATQPAAKADMIYDKLCLRCHGIAGTGTGPEHLQHLPRPRNLTNRPYFAALADDRIARAIADGIPGTAMPVFRQALKSEELWAMVEKVRTFSGGME